MNISKTIGVVCTFDIHILIVYVYAFFKHIFCYKFQTLFIILLIKFILIEILVHYILHLREQ